MKTFLCEWIEDDQVYCGQIEAESLEDAQHLANRECVTIIGELVQVVKASDECMSKYATIH